jgi:hypothetical protein
MKIVIIGWGSLIWDPRELPREGTWIQPGPLLPIEFSRVSSDARLTLVIDPSHGEKLPTRYVGSPRSDISDAIADLKDREGTATRHIGFVDLTHDKSRAAVDIIAKGIREWAATAGIDGVVWTDLPSNFDEETGLAFSLEVAERYLRGLPKTAAEKARKYINNAPSEVNTPLRRHLSAAGWLA